MKSLSRLLIAVVFISLCAGPALARDEILIGEVLESGGYGGPTIKVSEIKGETGVFVGGYGGWLINHTFMIGGGGYGLVNNIQAPIKGAGGETLYYDIGYGGLVLEYIDSSHKLIHYTINALIGGGVLDYKKKDWEMNYQNTGDVFFVFEPGFNVELNVSSFFRVGLGVSYRFVNGIELEGTSEQDLRGVAANLTLKFGMF